MRVRVGMWVELEVEVESRRGRAGVLNFWMDLSSCSDVIIDPLGISPSFCKLAKSLISLLACRDQGQNFQRSDLKGQIFEQKGSGLSIPDWSVL